MNFAAATCEEWVPFLGKELHNSTGYVVLKTTDGSGGIIKVSSEDFMNINGRPHIRSGSKARLLVRPH